mmetsp:Transcript_23370/g.47740  ORF Transcript_23370/g.47740 Transcript_23370/m.47740 type:complete len:203 (+) Transcript_23370:216-824(+)
MSVAVAVDVAVDVAVVGRRVGVVFGFVTKAQGRGHERGVAVAVRTVFRDVELAPIQEPRKILRGSDAPGQHGRGQGPAQEFFPREREAGSRRRRRRLVAVSMVRRIGAGIRIRTRIRTRRRTRPPAFPPPQFHAKAQQDRRSVKGFRVVQVPEGSQGRIDRVAGGQPREGRGGVLRKGSVVVAPQKGIDGILQQQFVLGVVP